MQRVWTLIAAGMVGCSGGNGLVDQKDTGVSAGCTEVSISDLPISEVSLRRHVSELTGYESGYELGRPCRYGDGFLVRVVPPEDRRHGIFTVLLMIDEKGGVRVAPSQ